MTEVAAFAYRQTVTPISKVSVLRAARFSSRRNRDLGRYWRVGDLVGDKHVTKFEYDTASKDCTVRLTTISPFIELTKIG